MADGPESRKAPPFSGARSARTQRSRLGLFLAGWVAAVLVASVTAVVALAGWRIALGSGTFRERVREAAERQVRERWGPAELGPGCGIDWLGRAQLGPMRVWSSDGRTPLVDVETIRVRPSYRALLRGRVEPASVGLERVTIYLGPKAQGAAEIVHRFHRKRPGGAESKEGGSAPLLWFEEVRIVRGDAGSDDRAAMAFGPFSGQVRVSGPSASGELELVAGRIRAELAPASKGQSALDVQWDHLGPAAWPEGSSSSIRWAGGDFSGRLRAQLEAGGEQGRLAATGQIEDLLVALDRILPERIGPLALRSKLQARWSNFGRDWEMESLELGVGKQGALRFELEGGAQRAPNGPARLAIHLLPVEFQGMLSALPLELRPGPDALHLRALLSGDGELRGPLEDPEQWRLFAKLELSALRKEAKVLPMPYRQEFLYSVHPPNGTARDIWVGPTNPHFVPLSQLPPHVVRAVTTSEDAGFFAHQGFDFDELRDSLVALAEGERVRGASTITQQLAKNLFLSREKTFGRKIREALWTLMLESSLSKSRILEIYLNLIEWGPNVYGIDEAAQHYFGTDAPSLTVKQAAFLASIIPNPIKYHFYLDRGGLTDTWDTHLGELLAKMNREGFITPEEYEDALHRPLIFRPAGAPEAVRPVAP